MGVELPRRVARYASDHGLLPDGAPVLALVSGGADSICLMHLLCAVHRGPIGVVAFDHGLRAESADEAAAVVEAAERLGLPAWAVRLDLAAGAGVQARARDARYAAARAVAAEHGFELVATGHTASDQAETVLFRIARGAGRTGALGMAPRSGEVVRPLLCVTGAETRAWCAANGIAVVADPSNDDTGFARTRVRVGLLPALGAVHPGAELAVGRFADQLRDEAELIQPQVDAAWERCAAGNGLRVDRLAREHPALARLLVRRLLAGAGIPADAMRVARSLGLARRPGGHVQVPGGIVAVDRGVLVAEGSAPTAPPADAVLPVPGAARFAGLVITAARGSAAAPSDTRVSLAVDGPLAVRSPRAGDRIALPAGGRQAVGRLLAAAGVPARRRSAVPVVVSGDRVVWVAGYRADPTLLAAPGRPATVLEVVHT